MYQKVNQQTESLRGLWVAKLNLRGRSAIASPEDLQLYENKRKEVCVLFLSCNRDIFISVDLHYNYIADIHKMYIFLSNIVGCTVVDFY